MIVLDTNVISEPMRGAPDGTVMAWVDEQVESALFTTSVTVMELRFGLAGLPEGKRKSDLHAALDFTLSRLIGRRILPFDTAAAIEAAEIAALAEAAGTPIGQTDSQTAAIAKSHGFSVATRDTAPFQQAGLTVINPWETG